MLGVLGVTLLYEVLVPSYASYKSINYYLSHFAVRIENRTAKPVKNIKMHLETTQTTGKKKKITKSKTQLYKEGEGNHE